MTLHIQLLGDFYLALHDAATAPIKSVRLQSLLAYLLLHREAPQPRQHLAYQFWPDSTEQQARSNLRKALHQLRRHLPHADLFLHVDARTVQWNPDAAYVLDVAEFEMKVRQGAISRNPQAQQSAWEAAVALYGGDLLRACYDEWILPERERLHQAFIETLESLVRLAEERRQYETAIRHANRLLRHDPLHESTYARLMRLYAIHGDRAKALQTYQLCTTVLQRELNVEPGPQIQRAYARLLAQEGLPASPIHGTLATPAKERLVGREDAWKSLRAAWERASRGQVHFCLIRGEAGIGKTRLAEELLTWAARQGIATARTRAYAAAGGLVYAPVMEWLRSAALKPGLASVEPVWLTEVARLLPELLSEQPELPHPEPWASAGPGQWQRHRLFEALTRALLADPQPKLLQIDDLQWCDGETVAWLHYLFRFVQGTGVASDAAPRLLIVGTVRPGEVDAEHPLTPLRLELMRSDAFTEIALAPLNAQQTAELAAQVVQAELQLDATTALHSYTGGNPLFVVETVHSSNWRETIETADRDDPIPLPRQSYPDLPARVQSVIQARLMQLSPAAQDLASLAAVIGRSFTVELLCCASNDDEETVLRSLEELWQRHLVQTQDGHTYDFSHDRIRDAAWAAISPVLRPRLHGRVAAALEVLHGTDLDPVSAQLAAHYEQSGEYDKAINYYQRAAAVAHARVAEAMAVTLLEQALRLVDHLPITWRNKQRELSIILQMYEPLMVAGGYFDARLGPLGERAMELAHEVGDRKQFWHGIRMVRIYYAMRGQYAKAQAISELSIARLGTVDPNAAQASSQDIELFISTRYHLAHMLTYQGKLLDAQACFNEFLQLESVPVQPRVFGGKNSWLLGYPDTARSYACQALVKGRQQENPHMLIFATVNIARLHHFMYHFAEMKLLTKKALFFVEKYEMRMFWVLAKLFQGRIMAEEGQTQHGIAQIEAMLGKLDEHGHMAFRAYFLGLLAESHACASQFSQALDAVEQGLAVVESHGEGVWHAELLRLRGEYLLALDRPAAHAEETYRQAIAVAQQQSAKSLELRATMSLARLWQQQGRAEEALTVLTNIYNWFTEGFKTHDLREARALLATLSPATASMRPQGAEAK